MNRKTLILSVGIVIIALVSVSFAAVVAEPTSTSAGTEAKNIKKILGIVKDVQPRISDIQERVYGPPVQPNRYEFYTASMGAPNSDTSICAMAYLLNAGDSVAEVHWELHYKHGSDDWIVHSSNDESIDPGTRKGCFPSVVADYTSQFYYTFSTSSKYVVPTVKLLNATSGEHFAEEIEHYFPGDFHKVEIYDEWS